VTVRLPIKGKPTTSLLSASCLLTQQRSSLLLHKTTFKSKLYSEAFYHPFRRIALTIQSNRNVSLLHSLRGQKERQDGTFCTQCLKSACLVVFILKMTFFKLLKCTVAKPPICCSCFCNEQLNKNVKCGKEYFTLNVSNIVLVIFKSFITFCC